MTERLTTTGLSRMVAGAAARIRAEHAWLSELDSHCGDGDHGAAMLRAVERLEEVFAGNFPAEFKACLERAGWNVMAADGGASTALLGSFFLGMAEPLTAEIKSVDCRELAAAFEAGLRGVRRQTKAKAGDKTMMDALMPAIEEFGREAQAGQGMEEAMGKAAAAAKAGAEATKEMTATFGRARFLREKTRGYPDPGATSVALIFDGFHKGLAEKEGESPHA
ncbi:MAG: dihydroxyacetone kinase subunit DhaL [Candidatus Acidiferrum sp.]|jgi:dihydroxyacetone kinase-like protein